MEAWSYRGLYLYAWDLLDAGPATLAAAMAEAGLNTVTLAAAYHAGKFLRPQGRNGKVYFPEDGTLYFRPRLERYGRIKPNAASFVADVDPLAEIARAAPDLARVAWVVACHNTRLGSLHPDLVARNAFGDPYPYSLCPAEPAVRDYMVELCADLADQHELKAVVLETPGWLPYPHGFHHEFSMVPLNAWAEAHLALCFAPASLEGARAAGIDAETLRREACRRLEGWLAADRLIEPERAAAMLLADLALAPDWTAYLRWRCTVVAELVRSVRAALPRGTELWVIPSVQRPTAAAWLEGSDLAMLAQAADRLEICAYEPTAAAVASDLWDVRRRAGEAARLNAILRPHHPDLAGGSESSAAACAARRAGCEGLAFYNWGHWRRTALANVAAATAAWEAGG
jgi:hypothetical protein